MPSNKPCIRAKSIGIQSTSAIYLKTRVFPQLGIRQGNNGFTFMPGNPKPIGQPPMCADAAAMQWLADFKAHKPKPTNTEPGIIYMLAGVTQRSDTDPYDTTS